MPGPGTEIGDIIRRERKARGLTQRELASRCSVSDSFVAHLEAGFRLPSDPISLALSRAFEWSPEQQRSFLQTVEEERVNRSRQRIRTRAAAVRDIMDIRSSGTARTPRGSPRTGDGHAAEMDADRIAKALRSDPDLAEAYGYLAKALGNPELRETVMNALRVFAESSGSRAE